MHKAHALVLTCIDFRFQTLIQEFLEKEELVDSFDRIAIAGAVLQLVSPEKEAYKEYLLKQIDISMKLHDPDTIYLINHEDCGAYGDDNTMERHTNDLRKAKMMITSLYPNKEVRTFIAKFTSIEETNL